MLVTVFPVFLLPEGRGSAFPSLAVTVEGRAEQGGLQTKGRREGRRRASAGGSWGQSQGLGGGGQQTTKAPYIRSPCVFRIAVKKPQLEASFRCVCLSVPLKPTWTFQGREILVRLDGAVAPHPGQGDGCHLHLPRVAVGSPVGDRLASGRRAFPSISSPWIAFSPRLCGCALFPQTCSVWWFVMDLIHLPTPSKSRPI